MENQHEGSGSGKRKFARGVKDLVRPHEVLLHVCCTLKQGPGGLDYRVDKDLRLLESIREAADNYEKIDPEHMVSWHEWEAKLYALLKEDAISGAIWFSVFFDVRKVKDN